MVEANIDWSRVVAGASIWVQSEHDAAPRVFLVLSGIQRRDGGLVHCCEVGEDEAVLLPRAHVRGIAGPRPRPAGEAVSYPPLRLVDPLPDEATTSG